jgi:thioredoxin 1
MAIALTDENFEKETQRTDKLALVDFYATWCEPCSLLAPILEKVAAELSEKIVLMKANVDENQIGAGKFQVDRIPMVVLLKNGEVVDSFSGLRSEPELKEWLADKI